MGLPYFPFYPDRWLSSGKIDLLTLEQEGAYIRLLARAWGCPECTLPSNENILLRWSRLTDANALQALMRSAFEHIDAGYRNPLLYKEWQKAKEKHKKAVESANSLWNKKKQSCERIANAQQTHSVGNANQNQNQNQNETQSKKVKIICPDALRLSGLMADLILQHTPDHRELKNGTKEKTIERWAKDIDFMLRLDKRLPGDIEKIIIFSHTDSFWFKNILSGAKLREKFDQLGMNMKQAGRKKHDKHAGIDAWLQETYHDRQ